MKRWIYRWIWAAMVPLVLYEGLVRYIADAGGATVMLGAVAGTRLGDTVAMASVLILRLYLVLFLPSLLTFSLVRAMGVQVQRRIELRRERKAP